MRKSVVAALAIAWLVTVGAGRLWAAPTIIRRGSTGASVKELQKSLGSIGIPAGPADGIFGPATEKAVRSFQARKRIAVDGVVGPRTAAALDQEKKAAEKAQAERRRLEEKRVLLENLRRKTIEARTAGVTSIPPAPEPGKGAVYLTFDDGPDPTTTPAILDALKKAGVRATFFVIGSKAELNPGLLQRIVQEGHTVQNHGYSHAAAGGRSAQGLTVRELKQEIGRTAQVVQDVAGVRTAYFRPPYGRAPDEVLEASQNQGHAVALWSNIWGGGRTAVLSTAFDGAILMFNEEPAAARALPETISALATAGFRFLTLGGTP